VTCAATGGRDERLPVGHRLSYSKDAHFRNAARGDGSIGAPVALEVEDRERLGGRGR
jgi:hypothetical protein